MTVAIRDNDAVAFATFDKALKPSEKCPTLGRRHLPKRDSMPKQSGKHQTIADVDVQGRLDQNRKNNFRAQCTSLD